MNYWLIINKEKIGPLTLDAAKSMIRTPETMVWRQGLADWKRAVDLPEFEYLKAFVVTQPAKEQISENHVGGKIPPMPTTYFAWSIVAIFLCCMIPAIVALIYSTKVSGCYMCGDYDGAQKASKTAELWLIISITAGIVSWPFWIVMSL